MVEGLWYVCASAGLILIVGSLMLISKRIILLDATTGEVNTEFNLPFGIRLKTNLPVILMLSLGVLLLVFPIWQANEREKILSLDRQNERGSNLRRIYLKGPLNYPEPIKVYVIVAERLEAMNEVSLEVPLSQCNYTVSYWCANGARKLDEESVTLKGNETGYNLKGFHGKPETRDPLCGLATTRTEQDSIVDQFKTTSTQQ